MSRFAFPPGHEQMIMDVEAAYIEAFECGFLLCQFRPDLTASILEFFADWHRKAGLKLLATELTPDHHQKRAFENGYYQ